MAVSIKKLIRWLCVLQHNDPVAARAHHVIWKILKRCAPALQTQADELLALYEEGTLQPHAYQHHHVPHNARQTAQVPQGNFHAYSMDTSGTFDPRPFQYYPLDNLPEYQDGFNQFYTPDEQIFPMPFGNPFLTNFDHDIPLVNMQDLWVQPGPSNTFDPNPPHVDKSQDNHDDRHAPNAEYLPQQQQFDYRPLRG